ncbi:MAG TPA: DUF4912 domain-containing protein [Verrucomicrobiota bacterium]|nr:DUF4912 domain-containing protein [Verrucomicrobiota bacterium]
MTQFAPPRAPTPPREKTPELPALLLADDNLQLPPPPEAPSDIHAPGVQFPPAESPAASEALAQVVPPSVESSPAPSTASVPSLPPTPTPLREPALPVLASPVFPNFARVWLDARDAFSLVAQWEVNEAETAAYAEQVGGSWHVRVFAHDLGGPLMADQPVRSSKYRLVPVLYPGVPYVAELGFQTSDGEWRGLAVSTPVETPSDSPATIWSHRTELFTEQPALESSGPDEDEVEPTQATVEAKSETEPPAKAHTSPDSFRLPDETQSLALTTLVWEPAPVIRTSDSAAISQFVARVIPVFQPSIPASADSARPAGPPPVPPPSTSPASAEVGAPGLPGPTPSFWFEINAELILYGRTEPDAKVTVGGRPIALRDDGSFSFRFILPNGEFPISAVAVNAAGTDGRSAHLTFSRATEFAGVVGHHAQDPTLLPPVADAIR